MHIYLSHTHQQVMVKICPAPGSNIGESLHFSLTCNRSIHVKAFKKELASMLGCASTNFRLLDSSKEQRRLRDEEIVLEALQKTRQKWPAPYQGKKKTFEYIDPCQIHKPLSRMSIYRSLPYSQV